MKKVLFWAGLFGSIGVIAGLSAGLGIEKTKNDNKNKQIEDLKNRINEANKDKGNVNLDGVTYYNKN